MTTREATAIESAAAEDAPCARCGHLPDSHDGKPNGLSVSFWSAESCHECNCFSWIAPGVCVECEGRGEVTLEDSRGYEHDEYCGACGGDGVS